MNWAILSLAMLFGVVVNCIVAKRLLAKGVSGAFINFVNFFSCFVFYLLSALLSGRQVILTLSQFF